MKKNILFFCICLTAKIAFTQQTIDGSISHDGGDRTYILYVPENYTGDTPVPLVFNFHGYGSSASGQMWYGDFRSIADTVGFIIVHPQGTIFDNNAHWNVGGWTVGSTTDDVGFTNALIDSLAADYSIDMTRIYSTGMSNGGYMSFLLACQLSDRIAAIASVTGSMTPETYNDCNPQRPVPVLQIHGTDDSVVPYDGAFWTRSIEDAVGYWVNHNNCNSDAAVIDIPDIVTTDQSTVEHFIYSQADSDANVEHFKITGGDHTWPDNAFGGNGVNKDINGSFEVWKFFSQYDINGLITTTSLSENIQESSIQVFPNPTASQLTISSKDQEEQNFQLYNSTGQVMLTGKIQNEDRILNLETFSSGLDFLKVGKREFKVLRN